MKESRHVKTKIIAGYAVILVVCLAAVGYVYRQAVHPERERGGYVLLHSKRNIAAQTLYHLYQAEGYGQFLIAGYESYETPYRRELRTVRGLIDSLRGLERDTLQMQRLDSIARLVNDKERRTTALRRSVLSSGTARLLNKNIEALIVPPDTLPVDTLTEQACSVRHDTLRVERRKRRFFRRLADLFSPPKEDSGIVISTTRIVTDSLPAPGVSDTIASVLHALQDRVTGDRQALYDRAWNEGQQLRYNNIEVNRKIYRLLTDFENEDEAFLMRRLAENETVRRRSSEILGGIAAAAVVLMLLFVAVLWRDINRSNRYKRELERANREKEALLEAREKLMLAITHDIKAPLGSVMGYIDLLERITGDKRQTLYLQNMKGASEHLLALVNSLLDFYRLDVNKVDIARVSFDPAALFEGIRAAFAPAAARKGIALEVKSDPSAACTVTGDPFRIRQIADNLVSNAVKFTDRGGITVSVACPSAGALVFSVKDTGRGIGREEKERIFKEFVRLDSARGVDGFGLGLSIADRLVKLLGGRIWVESAAGRGSKFIVSLPVGAPGVKSAGSPPEASSAARGLHLLLVDDDRLQLDMATAMCRNAGFESVCCQYPEYAARLVREQRFDAVLTDIQMPAADGFAVLKAVREACPGLPVIAVSARSGELPGGFAAVLRKPFTAAELTAAVRSACGQDPAPENGNGNGNGNGKRALAAEPDTEPVAAPGFDALTAFAGDDPEARRQILESFAVQHTEACERLREALAHGDTGTAGALAHRMLPIFTMLGDVQTAALLRALEHHDGPCGTEWRIRVEQAIETVSRKVGEAQKELSLQSE